jgi:hypothetical protein
MSDLQQLHARGRPASITNSPMEASDAAKLE